MIQQNKDWNYAIFILIKQRKNLPEHDPTEQGLKQQGAVRPLGSVRLPEHDPTEQGLKLSKSPWFVETKKLPEHDPTEQGLKLERRLAPGLAKTLPEHDPTEQGLKLIIGLAYSISGNSPRAWSNRTRIETVPCKPLNKVVLVSPSMIQQNKDWNLLSCIGIALHLNSPSMIQQNKDWNRNMILTKSTGNALPEHDPTEQGLKHIYRITPEYAKWTPRAWSNRTRIETKILKVLHLPMLSPRAWSNRTRIETIGVGRNVNQLYPPRAWSNRTRIETKLRNNRKGIKNTPRAWSNRTRIETTFLNCSR